jgi:protein-L-isoaspartate O-methyltransferase
MSWAAALPTAKIVTGPLARGCVGEGPYDVILLQGSAEMIPRCCSISSKTAAG